ncbi:unnamed protein product [Rotaria sp. Silwood1]|nr:unnamed protein product [Rotaria sp. Silwood1]CAF1031137.1 unnamed protein product [Rotaria sp. Silwood1]CAF3424200.1 unnamed protein product [Rotaria sp. Silwood1]CAF4499547.1 unnamed protein product [Rotaria sp. Silwood1]
MEQLICHYLRILDIDPFGYFIRLINTSHNQLLNLSNIHIRQFSINNRILNSYTFNKQIRSLLHSGEVVTIYSRHYGLLKYDIEPHIFIAQDISQWLTDVHIRTEISINKIIFHSYKICSNTTNDVPLFFFHRSIDSKQFSPKTISQLNQNTRFSFPYCLSIDNIVNPHTWAMSDRNKNNLKRNMCQKNNSILKHFDSYSRRLTTAPKIIQSSKTI